MRVRLVVLEGSDEPIIVSSWRTTKELADYHLDLLIKCGSSCRYCSTNHGTGTRIRGKQLNKAVFHQLGEELGYAGAEPYLAFWDPLILDKLAAQIERHGPQWGAGMTLVFSQLTDAFSPPVLPLGITRQAIELLLERTSFRIRILTKNACVGSKEWIELFLKYRDRVVVGLSIGTLDDKWAKHMEIDTSPPSTRIRSLHRLQDAGISTFGMLCPMFFEVLKEDHLERLIEATRPHLCEHFWAEPYNDRLNWKNVRDAYEPGSEGSEWMTDVFDTQDGKRKRNKARWSAYATALYQRVLAVAKRDGWTNKLKYLLYEGDIVDADAPAFAGLEGVLLQSTPSHDGRSKNPHIASLQDP